MKAQFGILCALREHLSYLLSVSTPVRKVAEDYIVEWNGYLSAVSHQGRVGELSHHNAGRLLDRFSPDIMYSFGPAAVAGAAGLTNAWYEPARCTRLGDDGAPQESIPGCFERSESRLLRPARCLFSSNRFIANAGFSDRLAGTDLTGPALLDMTGYGIASACAERGVPWRLFRWITDRASDTAVSQFVRNVRDLAKRGHEVMQILQEVTHESDIIVGA